MLTSTILYIISSLFLAVATGLIIQLKKKPKLQSKETLPSYVLKQEKTFNIAPKQITENDPLYYQVTIDGEEPPEPKPFTSTNKFKAIGAFIAVVFGIIIYFIIIR
jgi:uncharacterized membrane protein YraQ (UPF0718 family)